MAVILPDCFIFLWHPRTGSVATAAALLKDVPGTVQAVPHHILLRDILEKHDDVLTGNEITITTVRNPFDVIASWWMHDGTRRGFRDFVHYIESFHDTHLPLNRMFFHLPVDVVLHWEHLVDGLRAVLREFNLPTITLERTNETKDKKPYESYYGEAAIAAMWKRYRWELEHFEYCFHGGPAL